MNMFIAVFTAFPRLLVPGVAFTLNFLQTNKKTFRGFEITKNSTHAKTSTFIRGKSPRAAKTAEYFLIFQRERERGGEREREKEQEKET
jgi:hypothetical protein